jgi:hypothetical protein
MWKKFKVHRAEAINHVGWQADATNVRVGFAAEYAKYHEWRTRRMPRRGLLFDDPDAGTLAPSDLAAVLDIVTGYLDRL